MEQRDGGQRADGLVEPDEAADFKALQARPGLHVLISRESRGDTTVILGGVRGGRWERVMTVTGGNHRERAEHYLTAYKTGDKVTDIIALNQDGG